MLSRNHHLQKAAEINMNHIDIAIDIALNPENSLGRIRKLQELKHLFKPNEHPDKALLRILAEEIINLRSPYDIQEDDSTINTSSDITISVRKRGRPKKIHINNDL